MIEKVARYSSGFSWKHNTQVKDWKARKSKRVTKSTYSNSERKYSAGLELQPENQGQENNQEGFPQQKIVLCHIMPERIHLSIALCIHTIFSLFGVVSLTPATIFPLIRFIEYRCFSIFSLSKEGQLMIKNERKVIIDVSEASLRCELTG